MLNISIKSVNCYTNIKHDYKDEGMKSRAAVAFAAGEPLQIVELDVEPPKLVKS
jgi:hypothetical protein